MTDFITEKLSAWNDFEARETNRRLEHLEKKLFSTYEICLPPNPNFWTRLSDWVKNAEGDQELELKLFNLLNDIFYVGPLEFNELYRRAYNGSYARWIVDEAIIDLSNLKNASDSIQQELAKTWFCGITDSLVISKFYHINDITNNGNLRPTWHDLNAFGDENKVRKYIADRKITRIVLLEDFVGNGNQIKPTLDLARRFTDIVNILVVPLIICPKGTKNLKEHCSKLNLKFEPVLALPEASFVSKQANPGESLGISELRNLVNDTYNTVTSGQDPGAEDANEKLLPPYFPLGWRETGGLIVMHTNTPNNSLPIIHWKSKSWNPIFPRHSRS